MKPHIFTFSTNEHQAIGNSVALQTIDSEGNITPLDAQKMTMISYENGKISKIDGFELSFGDIVALGGDYYAEINIGNEKDDEKAEAMFLKAFNSLSNIKQKKVVNKIFDINKDAEKQSEYLIQLRLLFNLGKKYFSITSDNLDHFSPWSNRAYVVGHNLALKIAQKGYELRAKNPEESSNYLNLAYQINAFACHYLTDSFSSGHLREQQLREMLPKKFGIFSFLGGILVNNMHNEDNKLGVYVTNKNGESWVAYGDDNYQKTKKRYSNLLSNVLTLSSKEIFDRYEKNISQDSIVSKYLPKVDAVIQNNFPPMFRLQDGKIQYRNPIFSLRQDVEYKDLNFFNGIMLVIKLRFFSNKTYSEMPHPVDDKEIDSISFIKQSIKATDLIPQSKNVHTESSSYHSAIDPHDSIVQMTEEQVVKNNTTQTLQM